VSSIAAKGGTRTPSLGRRVGINEGRERKSSTRTAWSCEGTRATSARSVPMARHWKFGELRRGGDGADDEWGGPGRPGTGGLRPRTEDGGLGRRTRTEDGGPGRRTEDQDGARHARHPRRPFVHPRASLRLSLRMQPWGRSVLGAASLVRCMFRLPARASRATFLQHPACC
jgi:hypothetical protein